MAVPLSVVVVVHDMARELPRTLHTLDPRHQRGIAAEDYEVVLVDNGSADAVGEALAGGFSGRLRILRLDPAPASPARAANDGIEAASGDLVGLIVDGARMVSPALLATALLGADLDERPVVTAPAWHLGSVPHMRAAEIGYDQEVEDRLLARSGWEQDGYALFSIATFAGSSWRGVFGPMGESSSLFLPSSLWRELDGLDERFDQPGGGLVNHDLYRRACELPGVRLVELLGEGTFHQYHGGAATSRRLTWDQMHDVYRDIRGEPYRPPGTPPLYVGTVPPQLLPHLETSVRMATDGFSRRP